MHPLLDSLLINLYRWVFYPTGLLFAFMLSVFGHQKLRSTFAIRAPRGPRHPIFDLPREKSPIWIHCSSGEFEYAKPVIKRLKVRFPEVPILVTYFSASYERQIKNFKLVDMSCPLPWDFPGSISSFIKHHQPRALLIARTDLWPELLTQMQNRTIPTLLFSATKSKLSPFVKVFPFLQTWIYKKINLIHAVSDEDRLNFLDLGADVVLTKGDTRYDQVFERLEHPRTVKEELLWQSQPILVAGSTWTEDESVLLPACEGFLKGNQLKLIIAPHEPTEEHIKNLTDNIAALGLTSQLYSNSESWSKQILIVDQIGILAELYNHAKLAFIGGSFKSSIHSVMEALAAGCLTIVGPYYQNNREAIDFLKISEEKNVSFTTYVNDAESFKNQLQTLLDQKMYWQQYKSQLISEMRSRTGSSQDVVEWVDEIINH